MHYVCEYVRASSSWCRACVRACVCSMVNNAYLSLASLHTPRRPRRHHKPVQNGVSRAGFSINRRRRRQCYAIACSLARFGCGCGCCCCDRLSSSSGGGEGWGLQLTLMIMAADIYATEADVCVCVCAMFNGKPVVYKWVSCVCVHARRAGIPRITLAALLSRRFERTHAVPHARTQSIIAQIRHTRAAGLVLVETYACV